MILTVDGYTDYRHLEYKQNHIRKLIPLRATTLLAYPSGKINSQPSLLYFLDFIPVPKDKFHLTVREELNNKLISPAEVGPKEIDLSKAQIRRRLVDCVLIPSNIDKGERIIWKV